MGEFISIKDSMEDTSVEVIATSLKVGSAAFTRDPGSTTMDTGADFIDTMGVILGDVIISEEVTSIDIISGDTTLEEVTEVR